MGFIFKRTGLWSIPAWVLKRKLIAPGIPTSATASLVSRATLALYCIAPAAGAWECPAGEVSGQPSSAME